MPVVFAYCRLPSGSPSRCVRRNHHLIDGAPAGGAGIDQGATDETKAAMVKMIGIEFIDHTLPRGAGADEGINLHVLTEVGGRFTANLIGVVLSNHALARRRVVWLADAREQKQTNIVHLEGAQDHKVSGLF